MSSFYALAAFLAAVLAPLASSGAEPNHSWDTLVSAVKAGSKIAVTRMNSAVSEGTLFSIDDQSISIQESGNKHAIARADVLRVRSAGARRRHALYGVLIGAGSGALILWAVDHGSKHPQADEAVGIGMLLGIPAGAIVGAAFPDGALLYEAPGGVRKTPSPPSDADAPANAGGNQAGGELRQ